MRDPELQPLLKADTLESFQKFPRSLRRRAWLSWWRPEGLPWQGIPCVSKFPFNRATRRKLAAIRRSKR